MQADGVQADGVQADGVQAVGSVQQAFSNIKHIFDIALLCLE